MVHCPWLLISMTMVFEPKCTVSPKLYKFCGPHMYVFEKAVQPLKSCTTKEKSCITKEKSCTSFVDCPWLLISLTMVSEPKCTIFPKLYKFCGPLCIFLKSCTTIKKLYIFSTLSLALNFIHNCVWTKMYSFFQSCTNSVVFIYIFSKSCTTKKRSCTSLVHCPWLLNFSDNGVCTKMYSFFPKMYKFCGPHVYIFKCCTIIEKLYNQRKKVYIFGTLSLALNFIDNGVCTEMYIFFLCCTNSVVLICIFWKSCTTKEKSCTSLVHSCWLLISLTMVCVPKCTGFSKAVPNSVVLICIFLKAVQPLKSCTTNEKSCTSLVHCS